MEDGSVELELPVVERGTEFSVSELDLEAVGPLESYQHGN